MVRFKSRYLVLELYSFDTKQGLVPYQPPASPPTINSFANQLRTSLATNFGHYGAALSGQSLSVKYLNTSTGTIIVRVARDQLPVVWATIAFISNEKVGIRTIAVTGTIKKAQRAAIRHAVTELRRLAEECKETRQQLKEAIRTCEEAIRIVDA